MKQQKRQIVNCEVSSNKLEFSVDLVYVSSERSACFMNSEFDDRNWNSKGVRLYFSVGKRYIFPFFSVLCEHRWTPLTWT